MFRLKSKLPVVFFCAMVMAGSTAISQTQAPVQQQVSVPDEELQMFSKAYQGVQLAQQNAQQKMIAVLEEEELPIETFNEIQQAKMQNQEINAPQSDVQKHAKVAEKIDEMQPAIQSEMTKKIIEANLTVEKYQQIAGALRDNPELMKRLQQLMEE